MAAIWHGAMGRIRNLSGPLSSTSLEYSYCLILSAQNGTEHRSPPPTIANWQRQWHLSGSGSFARLKKQTAADCILRRRNTLNP